MIGHGTLRLELYEKASELPADERAELAGRLLESIEEESDKDVEERGRQRSNDGWQTTAQAA